jgi:DNA-binding FadR family transcriptional regulator
MSFGFTTEEDDWIYPENNRDPIVRHIIKLREIFDVSYVAFAAYNDTSVALRHMKERESAAVPPGGNGGTDDPARSSRGLRRKKLELKSKCF